jgi:NADPH:quinone reductase-like Zn-dependent oxidoreductase
MKALICHKYGSPEVLSIKEVEMPIPDDNEILVKVYATTVNRTDLGILHGTPYFIRLFTGLLKPRLSITGTDFAGQIDGVGKNVTSFKVGDRVMGFGGMGLQSHAQYLALPEAKAIIKIPESLTYDQAAACLEAPFYALDNIDKLKPHAGQKVLLIGATGAIGSSMVQILKFYGVHITAVCGIENSELVSSLGADKIIDCKNDDFTKHTDSYDFVFDAVGKSSFSRCKPLLKKNGIYTSTDGFINIFLAIITPLFGGKKVVFTPPKNVKTGISFIKGLVEQGSFRAVIDRNYPFDKIVEAYKYVATGQKIGNVIITIRANET